MRRGFDPAVSRWHASPRMRAHTVRAVLLLVALLPCAVGSRAHAQSLAGTWQAGATTMDVAIDSWGKDCGPRPQSTRSAGGGSVQVDQQGDRLIVHGRDRDVYSDRCGSPNPAIKRLGSTHTGNTWTTRCRTDKQDPRQELATYTFELLAPDRLQYRDQSHFNWRLEDSTCVATITTVQTLERKGIAPVPPLAPGAATVVPSEAPTPAAVATTPAPPCIAGAPVRLSLRPPRAELQLGERVCFEPHAVDAQGCALDAPAVRFALDHGPGIRGRLDRNCFRAAQGSAEGEGTFHVIATLGGLRSEASVVVSAEALPSLIAARVESAAITGEADAEVPSQDAIAKIEPAPPPPASSISRLSARAATTPPGPERRMWLVGLALLLVALAVAGLLRRERLSRVPPAPGPVAPKPPGTLPRAQSAQPRTGLRCPTCGERYPAGSAFCGSDGSTLVPDDR